MEILKIISGPLLGSIIGYGTNFLAIKMLFRPYREVKILGKILPFTPGIIPKRKPELAKAIGNVVGNELFTKDDIKRTLNKEKNKDKIIKSILEKINSNDKGIKENLLNLITEEKYISSKKYLKQEVTNKIQKAILSIDFGAIITREAGIVVKEQISNPLIKMFLSDDMINSFSGPISDKLKIYIQTSGKELIENSLENELKNIENLKPKVLLEKMNLTEEIISKSFKVLYEKFLDYGIDELLKNINIEKIVESKINEMKIEDLEKLILKIMKKELNVVVNLGALLGFLIGLINIIFVL